jgi:hypothetical protein
MLKSVNRNNRNIMGKPTKLLITNSEISDTFSVYAKISQFVMKRKDNEPCLKQ